MIRLHIFLGICIVGMAFLIDMLNKDIACMFREIRECRKQKTSKKKKDKEPQGE